MVTSVETEKGLFFPSEKVEKRNRGQTLKKINKKTKKPQIQICLPSSPSVHGWRGLFSAVWEDLAPVDR